MSEIQLMGAKARTKQRERALLDRNAMEPGKRHSWLPKADSHAPFPSADVYIMRGALENHIFY